MAAPGENLKINGDRLWNSLMDMAEIGPGVAGGNNRQTLTDEDGEGRHLFQKWCDAAGCSMGVDQMGNMFAMRPGTEVFLAGLVTAAAAAMARVGGCRCRGGSLQSGALP